MVSDVDKTAADQSDKTGEFFTVGGPLHAVRSGYIRRPADDQLVESVLAHRYAYISAPNRSGKTSLIAGASAHLENNGIRVAVLDLEQISSRETDADHGRWYYNIAYRLLRQLRIRFELQEWWQDKSVLSNRQRLLEFYSEVLLQNLDEDIVVFVDCLQCVEELPFADQLLASIRSAFNARSLDPDFMRLTFVLVGEYDPQSLMTDIEISPFSIARRIRLEDFSRDEISLFTNELNLPPDLADAVLDRIYYWTAGQPYLTQKLARGISRAGVIEDPKGFVDGLVKQQFGGRSAVKNEPHMSHIHRRIVLEPKSREALLSLYGRVCKGVNVVTDLGDAQQRRLISVGLLQVNRTGDLVLRNHLYELVFTARWANENLAAHWRAPALAVAFLLTMVLVPFWYTQLLPKAYVGVLAETATPATDAEATWRAYRSFPGHRASADALYRIWLTERAALSNSNEDILNIGEGASRLDVSGELEAKLTADFFERRAAQARQLEQRDVALLATIDSLIVSNRQKRHRAAALIADDYPLLIDTLRVPERGERYVDPENKVISSIDNANVSQWKLVDRNVEQLEGLELSALDVSPVVRRVALDTAGTVRKIALRLRLSHQRLADLSIRLVAPSGKSVPILVQQERVTGSEELSVPQQQLRDMLGEDRAGTWSLSVRDQGVGVAGYLVAWSLSINSQVLIEEFERGINLPNPEETPASSVWVDPGHRFAIARSSSGDSVRIWDLHFSRPTSILPINETETLIGFNQDGTILVSAILDVLHVWDVARGELLRRIDNALATASLVVLPEIDAVLAKRVLEAGTSYQVVQLDNGTELSRLDVAGQTLLDHVSSDGRRLATVDYDRALRVWDLASGDLLAQMDLRHRPTDVQLSRNGDHVAINFSDRGIAQWRVDRPEKPVVEDYGDGQWLLQFSPSGQLTVTGRVGRGFQVRRSHNGSLVGPLIGDSSTPETPMVAFSKDEQTLITSGRDNTMRWWRIPDVADLLVDDLHTNWSVAFDSPLLLTNNGKTLVSADKRGHVHVEQVSGNGASVSARSDEVAYLGHDAPVRELVANRDGTIAASIDDSSNLKAWSLASGQPSQWTLALPAEDVVSLEFAPNGALLGVLYDEHLLLIDIESGDVLDDIRFIEAQSAFTFFGDQALFAGSVNGALRLINLQNNSVQQVVWQGENALSKLKLSPDGRQLIIADSNNGLLQFDLGRNELNSSRYQMPSTVRELFFGPVASRLYVRTERWLHSFSTSPTDLVWNDAVLLPGIPSGANSVAAGRNQVVFPTALGADIFIKDVSFAALDGPGLFGNREELKREWASRLGHGELPEAALGATAEPASSDAPRAGL